ncbi:class I SAM-dependent methyltransferase [Cyanobacterium sp. Dongsha4]|uniref:class I SAM-dependent methyltransferase n=1 Tax=Cyanobacterium sp. DS4 TaxID=2878255 RepID=UPI002E81E13F|nr:class I SAM-dependent methyltransferase [Cyanobacterium sp. Dongsha4]WVL02243.1 class I SAM-dependent methyltransferase [Cyanobacterium sp. Dongsha4]
MDSQKFLQLIPSIFDFENLESIAYKKNDFSLILENLNSTINPYVLLLLNTAVSCLEEKEVYCEVLEKSGASLISTLQHNPQLMAYGIIDDETIDLDDINNLLESFNYLERTCFYEGDVTSFCEDLEYLNSEEKIGLFYLDGNKSYREILLALMSIRPFLAEEAFIMISHTENQETKNAIADFQNFNNANNIHELLVVNPETKSYSFMEQELVILLWQNNAINKQIKRINHQGLTKLNQATGDSKKTLLHVGCGGYNPNALPQDFRGDDWVEIRLDIDPNVQPDIIGTITDLSGVPDNSVDAVYSSHNLEHIYNFEVPIALAEFKRVLKDGGFVMFVVPDMQTAAEWVMRGEMEEPPLYQSPAGPVPALWMFYGMGTSYHGMPYMAHKTGFTTQNLGKQLEENGFKDLKLIRRSFDIVAYGYK